MLGVFPADGPDPVDQVAGGVAVDDGFSDLGEPFGVVHVGDGGGELVGGSRLELPGCLAAEECPFGGDALLAALLAALFHPLACPFLHSLSQHCPYLLPLVLGKARRSGIASSRSAMSGWVLGTDRQLRLR